MKRVFRPAEILIPKNADMQRWSVVACDQFSSQPDYWEALEKLTEGVPSTLHLMLPEAYLESRDQFAEAERINAEMEKYLAEGVFETLPECYVYVERTLASGLVRRGIMGVLDLEEYDYSKTSGTPIRATEGTVEDRLPPRVRVRRGASLEMPHIMVFIDDAGDSVLQPLTAKRGSLPKLYDFELNAGGGHLRGYMVAGDAAAELDSAIEALADVEQLKTRYGSKAPAVFAMGDGNHSLATAKKCWEEIKPTLSDVERETHPARFSLVELVNIHDEAIGFEPIHKVVFDTEPEGFIAAAEEYWAAQSRESDKGHLVRLVVGESEKEIAVSGLTIGELIGKAEEFCQSYMASHGGKIDYIHNDDTAIGMGRRSGCAAVLLPRMEKGELFPSIIESGPFPKKSFSIGHAEDKRYYLECRKIK
ncbi:MAG: DUF1015 domain-containing protein [Oscillospiraceae bacterium]|nr:DUF1015 domain-containing protein [Oscillospiraceae bacterium]